MLLFVTGYRYSLLVTGYRLDSWTAGHWALGTGQWTMPSFSLCGALIIDELHVMADDGEDVLLSSSLFICTFVYWYWQNLQAATTSTLICGHQRSETRSAIRSFLRRLLLWKRLTLFAGGL